MAIAVCAKYKSISSYKFVVGKFGKLLAADLLNFVLHPHCFKNVGHNVQ
jgi:hypothetical protein